MSTVRKESRRQRGEIACAECRRLKVKCDRIVPCSTCVKRGTAALCPNETIPPGDGQRFVLAAEDHLRRKMTKMEERMHALEDALAIVQAQSPEADAHPLLKVPFSPDEDEDGAKRASYEGDDADGVGGLANAFGSLHMDSDHGASRFFGPSGGSEVREIAESEPSRQPPSCLRLPNIDPSYLPRPILLFYSAFPLTPPIPSKPVQALIESFLPPLPRATRLCETLLANLTWMFSIVSHRHLVGELIPAIYLRPPAPTPSAPSASSPIYGPHDLALLLIALALGALIDLGERPYGEEAQHYYRLARAALGLESILEKRSVTTVKALHLMSAYCGMSGEEGNLEHCYSLLNMAGEVALAVNMDPSLWGFAGKEAYERRTYFWSLLQGTLWQSLITGRPPAILETFIDCRLPTAADEEAYTHGEVPLGFGVWSYRFTLECLLPVAKVVLASHPPTYRVVLDLDRKIRGFHIPVEEEGPSAGGEGSMQVFVRSHYSELTLLFLHRGFFAQALTDNPTSPIMSAHGQSFISAYKAACAVLDSTRAQYEYDPGIIARVWRVWSYAFSASVIIGTVAIRSVNSLIDPDPFKKLEEACTMFQSGAQTNSRALRALVSHTPYPPMRILVFIANIDIKHI
ncbi:hypothetical protein FIBSPDRAFT_727667 [Athelia psychrophila]|uniref:Zn(2)-C6 fungal-type domain-containing protein n=1 Tax=Athelia psychrophila TaxID=1759441 RepID=A0A166SAV4_9AGAM|nr:hypothetical protein FIBSPDRAFT_727667 [Fibularhizoctonia sp. CBS 109695]